MQLSGNRTDPPSSRFVWRSTRCSYVLPKVGLSLAILGLRRGNVMRENPPLYHGNNISIFIKIFEIHSSPYKALPTRPL